MATRVINGAVLTLMIVVLLILAAMALGAQTVSTTAPSVWAGGSTAASLTINTPIDVDLDRASNIYCEGWDYAKAAPFGCHEPPALFLTVRYTGKTYHLSRAELIDAVKRQLAVKGK